MKALSIRQPWAWLIAKGYKDIENRTWRLNHPSCAKNVPMRIYIHASKHRDNKESLGFIYKIFGADIPHQVFELSPKFYGAIIGEVDIIGCVSESKSPWFIGPYGFILANPVLYDKPIPYKGQLGFFEVNIGDSICQAKRSIKMNFRPTIN